MLVSGGPMLTVSELGENGKIECIWFDTEEYFSMIFPRGILVKAGDGPRRNTQIQFGVGDVVQLASYGPLMTVSETYPTGFVQCVWHQGNKFVTRTFPSHALREPFAEDAERVKPILAARAAAEAELRNTR